MSASQRACDWSRIQESNSVLSLVYQSRCTVAPAHMSAGAHRIVCCSNKPTLKWYCGALVFLHISSKGYCSVVRKAGEQSPQTQGSQSSATARIGIIGILLTAAPPVNSLKGFCINTDTTRGNKLHSIKCSPLCKINSCHQGIRVTICFVCFPSERTAQRIKRTVYWVEVEV